jgi:PPM family protein phosphatase
MELEAWSHSDIGLIRKSNQDALGVYPDLGLFILADGMGGHASGEVASRMAVEAIYGELRDATPGRAARMARLFARASTEPNGETVLRTALERANQQIMQAGATTDDDSPQGRMGSTAVVLLIALHDARASWAHVGDSRLYRMRTNELTLLTADHTLPGDRYRNQVFVPTDLPHTNVLLQALGTQPEVDVAVGTATVELGDLFLLCSDGISGMVGAAFIQTTLQAASTLEAAGQALLRGALDAGGRDNATLILIRVVGA